MRRAIRAADVIKTNQSVNAWWFVLAARVCRRPIALRCGYVFGEYLETTQGRDAACRWYQVREGWAFRHATACIVPTDTLKSWVCRRYRVPAERVHTVPNFVDTDAFARTPGSVPRSRSVIHVGTISPVKNPELLVRACAKAGAELLTFVGDGPDAAKVQRLAAELGVPAVIAGRMPHAQLPAILRSHAVYVQPSLREGHCKSLTEAMACGLACVGTEVPGIVDSIRHEQTGLLCRLDADALGSAIRRLFDDDALRRRLGENAAAVVRAQYAFQPVFDREFSVMSSLVKDPSRVHAP
jgi:glycosyltransferase involved in cell wall biosynthesis